MYTLLRSDHQDRVNEEKREAGQSVEYAPVGVTRRGRRVHLRVTQNTGHLWKGA